MSAIDHLLANDGILPSQQGSRRGRDPVRDLHAAILEQALRDTWEGTRPGATVRHRQRAKEALQWLGLKEVRGDWEFAISFEFTCHVLNFEPEPCRERIGRMLLGWRLGSLFKMPRPSPRGAITHSGITPPRSRQRGNRANSTSISPRHIIAAEASRELVP